MSRYEIKETRSGSPTLVYRNGAEIRLHSAYDPEKEAARAVESFQPGRANLIVISGCGLGYHVKALRERFPGMKILVLESSPEVADLARRHCPSHLDDVPVALAQADLSSLFESFDVSEFRGLAHYVHRPSHQICPGFYDGLLADIKQYLSSKISDLLTRFEFETKWMENILANAPAVFRSRRVAQLFGRFKGCPGIIVSAGPSLRKSLPVLRMLEERALIVCVDTAAKVLDRAGITPHVIMTLDAQKHSLKHFLGLKNHAPLLLADLVSSPSVVRGYRGPVCFSTTTKFYDDGKGRLVRESTPFVDWMEPYLPPIGDVQSGGSVSTNALDLMLSLGCDPIVLVGQDLAYTGREIHCSGTHHNDDWLGRTSRLLNLDTINQGVIRKRQIKYVEAYGGSGRVIADFVFDLYRGWFEDSAVKIGPRLVNSTGGGARIRNAAEMPLEDLSRASGKDPVTLSRVLGCFKDETPDPRPLGEAVQEAISAVRPLIERTGSPLEKTPELADSLLADTDRDPLRLLFAPLLRKTRMYIARRDLSPERSAPILVDDIRASALKLLPLLEKCAAGLLSGTNPLP